MHTRTYTQKNRNGSNKGVDGDDDDVFDVDVDQVNNSIQIECTMSCTQNTYQTEFVGRLCSIILDIARANLFHAFNT